MQHLAWHPMEDRTFYRVPIQSDRKVCEVRDRQTDRQINITKRSIFVGEMYRVAQKVSHKRLSIHVSSPNIDRFSIFSQTHFVKNLY